MKVHQEVTISSKTLEDEEVVSVIEYFCRDIPGWIFAASESAEYARACDQPSCCVIFSHNDIEKSAIHLKKRNPRRFYIPNIVPMEVEKLSLDQYNMVASKFASDLRGYLRKSQIPISVSLSKPNIGVSDVIPGKLPRKLFDRFMSGYPTSYHPSDISRLDQFTCSLARYSRRSLNFERFERLLIEDYGWNPSDADRCRSRVETGIEVITEYRKAW